MTDKSKVGKSVIGVKSNFREFAARRLRSLSAQMQDTGAFLDFYGGFGEIGEHGREMIAASKIAAGWAYGIEKELVSGSKKASSTTKHQEQAKISKARRRAKLQKPGDSPEKPRLSKLQRVPKKRPVSRD